MSEEIVENITKSDSNFSPTFIDCLVLPDINFNGYCLINNICIPTKEIKSYISYTLSPCLRHLKTDFILKNCLFGSVKLTKNVDSYKYKHSGYGVGFDSPSEFLFPDRGFRKSVILFGVDMSSS